MSSDHNEDSSSSHRQRRWPLWQKLAFVLAFTVLAAGIAMHFVGRQEVTSTVTLSKPVAVPGSGFLGQTATETETKTVTAEPDFIKQAAPYVTGAGGTFVGGFLVGWAFRSVVKLAILFTVGAAAIVFALSYFQVINIDMTRAHQQYADASTWVHDQGERAWTLVSSKIVFSPTLVGGLWAGFRRKFV